MASIHGTSILASGQSESRKAIDSARTLLAKCLMLLVCGLVVAIFGPLNCVIWLVGVVSSYLVVTLTESFMHDRVLHARKSFRSFQLRFPRLFYALLQGFRSHTGIHHASTFKQDHVTQFDDASHQNRVDATLSDQGGVRIIREDYGMTIKFRSVVFFLAPIVPLVVVVAAIAPAGFTLGFLIPVLVYPLMSKEIHPYLHMRYDAALRRAPVWLRPILRSSYMRYVWRHHWLHHRHPRHNFNLLLGGDYLRRVHKSPSHAELDEMRQIGMPVD